MSIKTECVFLFLGSVLATFECVISQGKRIYSTSSNRYEKLVKYQTLDGVTSLQKCAHERGDKQYLLTQIGHLSAEGIVAKDFSYHTSCGRHYTRPIKELHQGTTSIMTALFRFQLISFIEENVVNKRNIIKFSILQDKYKQFQEEHDYPYIPGLTYKNEKRRLE